MSKTYVVFGFLLAFCALPAEQVKSQGNEAEAKTKLEAFESQIGTTLIKCTSYREVNGVPVRAVEFTDVATGLKETGIQIFRSYIDYDEIQPLINAIEYISKITKDITQFEWFEASYTTNGGFQVSRRFELILDTFGKSTGKGKIVAEVCSVWIPETITSLSLKNLDELREFIIQAKQILDTLD